MENHTDKSVIIPRGYGSCGHSYDKKLLREWGAKLYPMLEKSHCKPFKAMTPLSKNQCRLHFQGQTREIGLTHDQIWAWCQTIDTIRLMRSEFKESQKDLSHRLNNHLVKLCERGMRESQPTGWDDYAHVRDYDPQQRLWLVGGETRYHYSYAFGDWWVGSAFLCGRTKAGNVWVTRVPKGILTVQEAVEFMKPAAVKKAEADGKSVFRQGDVFFMESRRRNFDDLPRTHEVQADNRTIHHEEHGTLVLPHERFKAILRKTVHGAVLD